MKKKKNLYCWKIQWNIFTVQCLTYVFNIHDWIECINNKWITIVQNKFFVHHYTTDLLMQHLILCHLISTHFILSNISSNLTKWNEQALYFLCTLTGRENTGNGKGGNLLCKVRGVRWLAMCLLVTSPYCIPVHRCHRKPGIVLEEQYTLSINQC